MGTFSLIEQQDLDQLPSLWQQRQRPPHSELNWRILWMSFFQKVRFTLTEIWHLIWLWSIAQFVSDIALPNSSLFPAHFKKEKTVNIYYILWEGDRKRENPMSFLSNSLALSLHVWQQLWPLSRYLILQKMEILKKKSADFFSPWAYG